MKPIYQLDLRGLTVDQIETCNRFYWESELGDSPTEGAIAQMVSDLLTTMLDCVHYDLTYRTATMYKMVEPGAWTYLFKSGFVIHGTMFGTKMPPNICAVVIGQTRHPRRFGRKFLSPVPDYIQQNGRIATDQLGYYRTFGTEWTRDKLLDGQVWHAGTYTDALGFDAFQGFIVSPFCGTNRHRKLGVGK